MNSIYVINVISVSIFGVILSAAFCDISWTRQKRWFMAGSMAVLLLIQWAVYLCFSLPVVHYLYPVTMHIPLIIVLCILSQKYLWPSAAVLTAYLFCQIRRWMALLVVAMGSGSSALQSAAELVFTLPLLLLFLRFVAPSMRILARYPLSVQCQFGLIPALYYGFDYMTRIYTDLLSQGIPAALEFMPFVCSVAYLIFVVHTSAQERVRNQLEQIRSSLNLQITGAVREIEALREAQRKTSLYHHDLRHHMQYISSCLENGRIKQAQAYIQEIYSEIEANTVIPFCENEAVNLIFSAFAGRAEKHGISIKIKAVVPQILPIAESDLCVLLSNGLENAFLSCQKQKEKGLFGIINVSAYEKKGKFFLQIVNSCDDDIVFDHDLPVAGVSGHGMGVRSICAIVERYGGIYSFSAHDGRFVLRVSL